MRWLTIMMALFASAACERKEAGVESAARPAAPRPPAGLGAAGESGGRVARVLVSPVEGDSAQVDVLKQELVEMRRERDEARQALEKLRTALTAAAPEEPAPALTPERRAAMLEGREKFNPGPIEESDVPVTEDTILQAGQPLQVKYFESWYAAEVVGFENDGMIHIRYFGWADHWDEIVPRPDLRLDPQARERAVDRFAARSAGRF